MLNPADSFVNSRIVKAMANGQLDFFDRLEYGDYVSVSASKEDEDIYAEYVKLCSHDGVPHGS